MAIIRVVRPTINNRTKLGNGSQDFLVPGNTVEGRRIRELRADFADEIEVAPETLSKEGQDTLNVLAHVSFELERLEAQSVSGMAINPMAFTRLIKEQRKLRAHLHTFRPKPPIQPPSQTAFDDHLDQTYGAAK